MSEGARDDWDEGEDPPGEALSAVLGPEVVGERLDKALAAALPELSRARLQALMAEGAVTRDGEPLTDASAKARPGLYGVLVPPPAPAEPEPQAIPLSVLYEDAYLIVVDKPAGMAAHPAPGTVILLETLRFHIEEEGKV